MNAKRLAVTYGKTNAKLMVLMHEQTDIARIEEFMAGIGAALALIICQSLRGIKWMEQFETRRVYWYPEVLFWLMACYNNPMFAKTYHLGYKYEGYQHDSLSARSYKGRRFRAEMVAFKDAYTRREARDASGTTTTEYVSPFTSRCFSFCGVEPSRIVLYKDGIERMVTWCGRRCSNFPWHVDVALHGVQNCIDYYHVQACYADGGMDYTYVTLKKLLFYFEHEYSRAALLRILNEKD